MIRRLLRFTGYLALGVFFVMGAIYTSLAWTEGERADGHVYFQGNGAAARPLVIAHRGGGGLAPENTLEAFRRSVELGVDVLELDVHSTADGALVVIHDRTVDRTTDGGGRVNEMSLAALKKLDAGHRFTADGGQTFPFRGQGVTIPTLDEVLQAFPEMKFNIEPKQATPSLVGPLCNLLKERRMTGKTIVASFNQTLIDEFRQACPDVATSAGPTEVTKFLSLYKTGLTGAFSPAMHALHIPQSAGWLYTVDGDFIRAARERNLQVHVWTVNEIEDMKRLTELGVDGIMTDYPDRLLSLFK